MSLILGLEPVSLFLTFLLFLILWKLSSKSENAKIIDKIPGPMSFPIVGTVLEILEPREKFLENAMKRRQKFGSVFRIWLGSSPNVILSTAEDIEILLKSTKHTKKSFSYRFLHPWLGTGLLTNYGKKWSVHRKLITPTFYFKELQNHIEVFYENANILKEKFLEKANEEEEFDIFSLITLCTLDIICETAMGVKINAQRESENQYVKSVCRLSSLTIKRIQRPWLHPDFIYYLSSNGREFKRHLDIVKGFSEKIIRLRKETLTKKDEVKVPESEDFKKRMTFLDLLLETSSQENSSAQLTIEELCEEVDTFMFAGHDTTSAGITWALFVLGQHPNIQEDVFQELKTIFDNDPQRIPTMADLAEMKLLERVIKETMRLYPNVTSISRIMEQDEQFGKYLVPKGTNAIINIYALHRDPKYYPNPEMFDPDRFLPENALKRHPYSYIPFSAGPRNCIGQKFALIEEKIVLSTLLRNFIFTSQTKLEEQKKIPDLILRPVGGVRVKIMKR